MRSNASWISSSRSRVSVKYGQTCGVAKSTAVPCSAALRQRAIPSSIDDAPSSPDGTTCEWQSTKRPRTLLLLPVTELRPEVELEVRRDRAQLAQRARL